MVASKLAGEEQGALEPVSGASRDGRPLAYHRAPAPDLAPWIARLFVTAVGQPEGQTLHCGLFNDTAFVRLIVRGDWTGEAANGPIRASRGALMFGPHSRRIPITVSGPFATFGFALKPGALATLGHPWGEVASDCIAPVATDGAWSEWAHVECFEARAPEDWLAWLEAAIRPLVAHAPRPDPLAEALDRAAFADPAQTVREFADRHGVSTRRVERMARRDFGLSPKQVLRRARVLDMASQLLGFADAAEAEEQALRYYDQSHLIRDFRALLGRTPRQLLAVPQPILSLGLEPRQARRLELIGTLDGSRPAPWR
jgi:AraC-like DNA-binding protein